MIVQSTRPIAEPLPEALPLRLYLPQGMKLIPKGTLCQIGRDATNEVVIDSPTVSNFHCQIGCIKSRWVITDLGSTNGTYLEHVHITSASLPPHGQIRLGDIYIPFQSHPSPIHQPNFFGIVGQSPSMQKIFRTIPIIAQTDEPVLICGETGTGKELVAKSIHSASRKAQQPWIARNCSAIPEGLADAELFGSVRGAFSGAESKPGVFEGAENGTVFLDEIGELPLSIQAKLLRTLQERKVARLGEIKERDIRCRLVLATHRDLVKMVKDQRFREDLYHRISVFNIHVPPLRKRREDIPLIIHHLLATTGIDITEKAVQHLCSLDWSGNIRQLQNILKQASAFCHNRCIQTSDLTELPSLCPSSEQSVAVMHNRRRCRSLDDEDVRRETLAVWEKSGRSISKSASMLGIAKSTMHSRKIKYHLPNKVRS